MQVRQRGPRQDGPQRQSGTKPAAGHVPPLRGASRPPEAVAEDAVAEVQRLEAAIAVLGESNPHARPLKDVLQAAKSRSRVPPVAEGIEALQDFPKTSQASRSSSGRDHQEGRRTERRLRGGGRGRRAEVVAVAQGEAVAAPHA